MLRIQRKSVFATPVYPPGMSSSASWHFRSPFAGSDSQCRTPRAVRLYLVQRMDLAQTNVRVVVPAPNRSPVDAEAIRRPGTAAVSGNSSVPTSQGLELSRVGAALAIVIALILGLRWGGKKLFGPTVMGHSTRAVQVLARSPVSARQSIVLVRVGRRCWWWATAVRQMNRLTEITDPDEVASLVGQAAR